MKTCFFLLVVFLLAGCVYAGDFLRVYEGPSVGLYTGMVFVVRQRINTMAPLAPGELSKGTKIIQGKTMYHRLPGNYKLPSCASKYYSWNGADIIEANATAKAKIDAEIERRKKEAIAGAAEQAADDADNKAKIRLGLFTKEQYIAAYTNANKTAASP